MLGSSPTRCRRAGPKSWIPTCPTAPSRRRRAGGAGPLVPDRAARSRRRGAGRRRHGRRRPVDPPTPGPPHPPDAGAARRRSWPSRATVATLVAAEWPIYGRYGYGPAIDACRLRDRRRSAVFREPPTGSIEPGGAGRAPARARGGPRGSPGPHAGRHPPRARRLGRRGRGAALARAAGSSRPRPGRHLVGRRWSRCKARSPTRWPTTWSPATGPTAEPRCSSSWAPPPKPSGSCGATSARSTG